MARRGSEVHEATAQGRAKATERAEAVPKVQAKVATKARAVPKVQAKAKVTTKGRAKVKAVPTNLDVTGVVHLADNLAVLATLPDACVDLVYIDPPFNTGKAQGRQTLATERHPEGDRTGFGGQRYRTTTVGERVHFHDAFDDYLAFLEPRLREAHRVLKPTGSLYLHLDYREVHYCKVLLDGIFGRACFLNEIIWAYDYGARSKRRWPAKHDNILWYAREVASYHFDTSEVDRLPYLAPGLVSAEKASRGKLPTDTWWHTIVSPTGKEKLGYPTQKPLGILRRIVRSSCPPGGLVLDFFAGSGTTGAAALESGRRFLLVDSHPAALEVMRRRFAGEDVHFVAPRRRKAGPKHAI